MKDLMMHVQPAGGMLLFPNTCRISGADPDPNKGRPGCQRNSARPDREGKDDPPPPDPACEGSRRPAGDGDRGPRRASGLDALRWALRAELAPGG